MLLVHMKRPCSMNIQSEAGIGLVVSERLIRNVRFADQSEQRHMLRTVEKVDIIKEL